MLTPRRILNRFRGVSFLSLPQLALIKIQRSFFQSIDRRRYSSNSSHPHFSDSPRSLIPISIIHPSLEKQNDESDFSHYFPLEKNRLLQAADKVVSLQFDLLGSGEKNLKDYGPDFWHVDFKSGHKWDPKKFFADVVVGEQPGVDIKVPWELSRCQHFITLGQAYALSGDEKYSQAFVFQVKNWIQNNPIKYGVNWVSPMDVALRACNWIVALDFFKSSPELNDDFKRLLAHVLYEHGRHIYLYREWNAAVSSNHYLSNLLGLLYIGLVLSKKSWVGFAMRELEKEIQSQTWPDGMTHEASTSYHRLVTEIYFYAALVVSRHHDRYGSFSSSYLNRLKQMMRVIQESSSQWGNVSQYGDNDGGRVHVFSETQPGQFAYLLDLAAIFFDDEKFKSKIDPTVGWIYGLDMIPKFNSMKGLSPDVVPVHHPDKFGLYTWRGSNWFLDMSVLPNGLKGLSSHNHNDKLAITLTVEQDSFFVDPGTGLYTSNPDLRNLLRSTQMHNTVDIDGEEQNRFDPKQLFSMKNDAHVSVDLQSLPSVFKAQHTGYRRLPGNLIHQREIYLNGPAHSWTLVDQFFGSGDHTLRWHFVLGPKIGIETLNLSTVRLRGQNGSLLLSCEVPGLVINKKSVPYSPTYGVVQETQAIEFQIQTPCPFSLKINLTWVGKNDPI